MPIYKCKGKDCGYATDDLSDFIAHSVDERLKSKPAEAAEELEPPKKRHITAEDYLSCPECFPKFEKAFLARGYAKLLEKKAEAERKELPL